MGVSHKYFMWPFQQHFQIARKIAAENLFRQVSPLFSPEFFVIGVLAEESPNSTLRRDWYYQEEIDHEANEDQAVSESEMDT